ncbi:hypothetical protein G5C51_15785 [Streptomyces sp. A7024]|uniref:Proline-rich protein n=1 Tax=Streptomyces coryli TaxID=1128680 RepID=A0A6G4U029_9ACTN|nr:hypothetical protein [Streptomyces coryli]NGN65352.1 hypothetical protein [Streptomyces coryli]
MTAPAPALPRQRVPAPYGDVLDVPAAAGFAVLGRRGLRTGPVARRGRRLRFLVAPGSAALVPELLDWLEWGGIPLDLRAFPGAEAAWEGAVWLRPPAPDVAARLPAMRLGGAAPGAPDLVRLVAAAATACHRTTLLYPALGRPAAASR